MKIYETLYISRTLATQLLERAQNSVQGIIGILFGHDDLITRHHPLINIATDAEHCIEVDMQAATRQLTERASTENWAGLVYSLPWATTPPSPLPHLVALCPYHLLIAMNTKGVLEITGYQHFPNTPPKTFELALIPIPNQN
jgi:hypothetical protein